MQIMQIEKEIINLCDNIKAVLQMQDGRAAKTYIIEQFAHDIIERATLIKRDRLTDEETVCIEYKNS